MQTAVELRKRDGVTKTHTIVELRKRDGVTKTHTIVVEIADTLFLPDIIVLDNLAHHLVCKGRKPVYVESTVSIINTKTEDK